MADILQIALSNPLSSNDCLVWIGDNQMPEPMMTQFIDAQVHHLASMRFNDHRKRENEQKKLALLNTLGFLAKEKA